MTIRYEKYIVNLYNNISGGSAQTLGDIPPDRLSWLCSFSYEEVVKPFIVKDFGRGLSRDQVAIKYGVPPNYARTLGEKVGRFQKRKRKKAVQ